MQVIGIGIDVLQKLPLLPVPLSEHVLIHTDFLQTISVLSGPFVEHLLDLYLAAHFRVVRSSCGAFHEFKPQAVSVLSDPLA